MAINEQFLENLASKYKTPGEWQGEKDKVQKILSKIESNIDNRYKIESPINIGGAGIVIKVTDTNLEIPQALKFPRPVAGKEPLLTKIMSSEISRLREGSHPNIISIFYKGEINEFGETWPFYIMEYIEGAVDALAHIENNKPDCNEIINILKQCVQGLIFLHEHNVIHCDIKLENILLSPDGRAKISDLGSARVLNPGSEDLTTLTFTREHAHPELRGMISYQYSDSDRVRADGIQRAKLKKVFDLYALGKNILRILKKYDIAEHKLIPMYYRLYLQLMACRLLDGKNLDSELALGLPKSAYEEIKYSSAEEVLQDLKKLTGEYSLHNAIPELDHHFPRSIQISSPASSSFTPRLAKILSSPLLRRLHGISQLGLIILVYPTATHSRFEHVLGTFANVVRYCDALWNDPINPLFKQIMSEYDINLVLLAALCHDIGQYPLAHDLEEAKLFSHKEITFKLLNDSNNNETASLRHTIEEDWKVKIDDILALLSTDPVDVEKPLKIRLLHTLIDGPMDADKVDYLIRDSNNLNVPYGKCIDLERLLKCLTVVFAQEGLKTFITLGIHEKGKITAEALAFARYAMFGSVYWHHTSRSAKSMLHRSVWEALRGVKDKRSKEYRNLQEEFLHEILIQGSTEIVQESLFQEKNKIALLRNPQLTVTDCQMLKCIYQKTSDSGKKLLEMILERKLFKRLLVVSECKNALLWNKLTELRKDFTWQDMLHFQNSVQEGLVSIIDSIDDSKRTSTILSKDITDEIVARASKGEVLFLVDIPGERKGSSFDLYYLSESRIYGHLTPTTASVHMEDSLVWTSLATNFLKSIGKIRVFCHPEIIETCTAALPRPDIEGILLLACRKVLGSAST